MKMNAVTIAFRIVALATIAYCVVAAIGIWNQGAEDRYHFRRLTRGFAPLPTGHENELQFHPIPNKEPLGWQWRIAAPEGFAFVSFLNDGMIAADAPRAMNGSVQLFESDEGAFYVGEPREFEFSLTLFKTQSGKWQMGIRHEGGWKTFDVSDASKTFLENSSGQVEVVSETQPSYTGLKEPVLIFRIREKSSDEFAPGICWYLVPLDQKDLIAENLGTAKE